MIIVLIQIDRTTDIYALWLICIRLPIIICVYEFYLTLLYLENSLVFTINHYLSQMVWKTNHIIAYTVMCHKMWSNKHDIHTVVQWLRHKSEFVFIKDTPYLILTGKLWGVCYRDFLENWQCYNSATLCINMIFVWGHICRCSMSFFCSMLSYLLALSLCVAPNIVQGPIAISKQFFHI